MEEAKIVKEKELIKPEFKSDIKAEIKSLGQIEDNIQDVQEYALKLNDYYSKIVFTEDTLKEAKSEKSEINKFKKKVSDFRKKIVEEYNKPLQKFIDSAKTTETLLADTYTTINNQVNFYEQELKEQKLEEIKNYFDELKIKENLDFITFEQTNINITLSSSKKSLREQVSTFVTKVLDDINLINTQQYIDEIMIEYKKDLNVSRAITDVNNRHVELERIQQEKENIKEQEITDEIMINKIDSLTAPKIEESTEKQQIIESAFVIRTTNIECLRELKKVVEKYNSKMISLTKKGEVYYEQ